MALTARVTYTDAAARVESWASKGAYSEDFGPEGKWTLPAVLEVADLMDGLGL